MSECGFCKGKPVGDAASWLDDKPRPPLPCPRCGEVNEQPVLEVARRIASNGVFVDADAIRVARALLDERETA